MQIMSEPNTALWSAQQIRLNMLSPGIISLFIQGVETGLVLTQLSIWLSLPESSECVYIIILTIFATTIGLHLYFLCLANLRGGVRSICDPSLE
ncbi:hypothetical protein B0F90DRAFT_1688556 [Multifurca ochricompacta]|uniref:Uncharacterized protein n=1 Tax=Multifurca ochricompacta TaxID=376703 RepID=A0AAD4M9Z3_9AGAM|nr:hypothetical protein B0F90DRAFT_1688556 [Multifurca ochricompacta]